jgi:hypothetical protein
MDRHRWLPFVVLAVAASLVASEPAVEGRVIDPGIGALPNFQGGFNLYVYGNARGDEIRLQHQLVRLKADGVNAVAIAFPIFQSSSTASRVDRGRDTPSNDRLDRMIGMIHDAGFSVVLRPLLDERTLISSGGSRGSIQPESVDGWFASYTRLLLDYATLAQRMHVEAVDVGTELTGMENWSSRWVDMTMAVRAIYGGKVTYSVSWNSSPHPFWSELDFIGVDAYFPLSLLDGATVPQLTAVWRPWLDKLKSMAGTTPIAFTEVGMVPQTGGYRFPWRWEVEGGRDYAAQARYYASACIASRYVGAIALYWWNFQIDGSDNLFDPTNHPAELEVRNCFAGAT